MDCLDNVVEDKSPNGTGQHGVSDMMNLFDTKIEEFQLAGMDVHLQEIGKFVQATFQKSDNKQQVSRAINGAMLITGQAGSGKTALVRKFCSANKHKYSFGILNIVNLISKKYANQNIVEPLLSCLSKLNKQKSIIVLDQFEQLSQPYFEQYLDPIVQFINKQSRVPTILLTNCSQKLPKQRWPTIAKQIHISNLNLQQQEQLIKKCCIKSQIFPSDMDYKQIAKLIGDRNTTFTIIMIRDASFIGLRRHLQHNKQLDQVTPQMIKVTEAELIQHIRLQLQNEKILNKQLTRIINTVDLKLINSIDDKIKIS